MKMNSKINDHFRLAFGRTEIVPSAVDTVTSIRPPLYESGVIVDENGRVRFTQDYLFRTPSGAAAVVLGRTSNGWKDWKDAEGRTLDEVRRVAAVEASE